MLSIIVCSSGLQSLGVTHCSRDFFCSESWSDSPSLQPTRGLVDYTRTLDYSIGGGPMIWRSPLWMPLAWEVVAVQFGYIGLRLWERFGKTGLLMIGLLGAINIPFYEEMARRIHWWQYSGCRMISYTPWYIIVGEFGIAVVFALLARILRRGSWREAILAGITGGASIFLCYGVAFLVTDRLIK